MSHQEKDIAQSESALLRKRINDQVEPVTDRVSDTCDRVEWCDMVPMTEASHTETPTVAASTRGNSVSTVPIQRIQTWSDAMRSKYEFLSSASNEITLPAHRGRVEQTIRTGRIEDVPDQAWH